MVKCIVHHASLSFNPPFTTIMIESRIAEDKATSTNKFKIEIFSTINQFERYNIPSAMYGCVMDTSDRSMRRGNGRLLVEKMTTGVSKAIPIQSAIAFRRQKVSIFMAMSL
jgi:hypothetical protein